VLCRIHFVPDCIEDCHREHRHLHGDHVARLRHCASPFLICPRAFPKPHPGFPRCMALAVAVLMAVYQELDCSVVCQSGIFHLELAAFMNRRGTGAFGALGYHGRRCFHSQAAHPIRLIICLPVPRLPLLPEWIARDPSVRLLTYPMTHLLLLSALRGITLSFSYPPGLDRLAFTS